MFESTPLYPDAGRYWKIVEDYKVNIFYTAPTAIRALAREGESWVKKYDRSSLRVLGTVGEPINPEAWEWYYHVVGEGRCAIVDTWWQTETGGIMITPQPGVTNLKPGSATKPFYGIQPVVVGEQGEVLEGNDVSGRLCIKHPWPGMARTVYGDHQRFIDTYFSTFPGFYFTGDGCRRDADGDYWITGRVDDVLNVSGHRLGTAEIEASINAQELVAESAVVGYPHDIKGTGIFAFVILNKDAESSDHDVVEYAIREQVTDDIGKIARPDATLIVPGLPKTRSGKIMRRILRKIAAHEYTNLGNVTTLADPSVVDQLIERHKAWKD
jgi:acetyl-CoA synthetase